MEGGSSYVDVLINIRFAWLENEQKTFDSQGDRSPHGANETDKEVFVYI